jgi:two-component system, OmpR family, sensor histidine kinase BaeS
LENVYEQFLTLRYFIGGVMIIGLLIGGGIALALGKSLGRSLQEVTEAVHRVSRQQSLTPLPEQGPQEIRQLLNAVNTLVDRLQTLEQNRRKLLANLVHELSNPLSALHSATNALLRGADNDQTLRKELLQGMQKEEVRLERLLADLSGLYDQVLGGLELHYSLLNLNQLLPQMVAPWREAALNKGLHWQFHLSATLPEIVADEDRLSQIMNNLLNNAIKYTPVNGMVSIRAGSESEEVWIQVSDTGPGISTQERHHIFTPFYRGTANRRFADGMGLGLSIAQDFVTAHNGRLQLSSTPDQGSQFTIWLPTSPN